MGSCCSCCGKGEPSNVLVGSQDTDNSQFGKGEKEPPKKASSNASEEEAPKAMDKAAEVTFHSDVALLPLPRTKEMGYVHEEESLYKLSQDYDLSNQQVIGKGGNGSVSIVTKYSNGEKYALKTIASRLIKDPRKKEQLLREIELQKALDHPNIVKVYESFEDVHKGEMYIVMELCTGGDLVSRLRKTGNRHGVGEAGAATLMEEMLSAVLYCHQHGVVHRDIKLDNFMLESPSHDSEVKLIDFGFACEVAPGHEKMFDKLGTPSYMAPELWEIRQNRRQATHAHDGKREWYDSAVDMWALGVTLFLLLSGQRPFFHQDIAERARMICEDPLDFPEKEWRHISKDAKDFVSKLLTKDPKHRMSAHDALAHPWIKQRSNIHASDAAEDLAKHAEVVAALQAYSHTGQLQKVALECIAFATPPAKMAELREMFHHIDTDDTGTITKEEFRHAMSQHPEIPLAQVDLMFQAMDTTHTGMVDYSEFLAAAISSQQQMDAPSVNTIFGLLDRDGDGFVSAYDLMDVLGMGETSFEIKEVEEMLRIGVGARGEGGSSSEGNRAADHHDHPEGIRLTVADFKYLLMKRSQGTAVRDGSPESSAQQARFDSFVDQITKGASRSLISAGSVSDSSAS